MNVSFGDIFIDTLLQVACSIKARSSLGLEAIMLFFLTTAWIHFCLRTFKGML